jgi:hypothetical protein
MILKSVAGNLVILFCLGDVAFAGEPPAASREDLAKEIAELHNAVAELRRRPSGAATFFTVESLRTRSGPSAAGGRRSP